MNSPRAAAARVCAMLAGDHERLFHAVMAWAVFLGCVQVGGIVLSMAEVAIGPAVGMAILAVSFALACAYAIVVLRGRDNELFPACPPSGLDLLAGVALLAALVVYALQWHTALIKPDFSWDGNCDHIPVLHFWARRGYVWWIRPEGMTDAHFYYWKSAWEVGWNVVPKAVELVAFVLVRATGSNALVNSPNLFFLPMGAGAVAWLARAMHARPPAAVLAGALYLLVPVNVMQGMMTMVDAGWGASVMAFLAATVWTSGRLARGETPWAGLVALGVTAGLTVGGKTIGVVLVAPAACMLVFWYLVGLTRAGEGRLRHATAVPVFFGIAPLLAVAVGGFWYARNYAVRGNPLYPIQVTVGNVVVFPGITREEFGLAHNPPPTPSLPVRADAAAPPPDTNLPPPEATLTVRNTWLQGGHAWPATVRAEGAWSGGHGFLWLLACLPAAVVAGIAALWGAVRAVQRQPWPGAPCLVTWLTLAGIIVPGLLLTPNPFHARFTLYLYGLGLSCLAWLLGAAVSGASNPRPARRLAAAALRGWVLVVLAVFLFESGYTLSWWATRSYAYSQGWPRGINQAWHALRWHDPAGYIMAPMGTTLFDEVLAGSDAVLFAERDMDPQKRRLLGPLCQPLGRRPVYFASDDVLGDPDAFREYTATHNIRNVFWDEGKPLPPALEALDCHRQRVRLCFYIFDLARPRGALPVALPDRVKMRGTFQID